MVASERNGSIKNECKSLHKSNQGWEVTAKCAGLKVRSPWNRIYNHNVVSLFRRWIPTESGQYTSFAEGSHPWQILHKLDYSNLTNCKIVYTYVFFLIIHIFMDNIPIMLFSCFEQQYACYILGLCYNVLNFHLKGSFRKQITWGGGGGFSIFAGEIWVLPPLCSLLYERLT